MKRFTTRSVGIKRILAASPVCPAQQVPKMVETGRTSCNKVNESNAIKKKRGRDKLVRGTYDLPKGPCRRTCRPNSGRGRLAEICETTGATFEELLVQLPQWDVEKLHHHIRNMHYHLGYEIRTDENGVIRAIG